MFLKCFVDRKYKIYSSVFFKLQNTNLLFMFGYLWAGSIPALVYVQILKYITFDRMLSITINNIYVEHGNNN